MLRTLLESQAARTRRSGGAFVSIVVHTALIALALAATARATSAPESINFLNGMLDAIARSLLPK